MNSKLPLSIAGTIAAAFATAEVAGQDLTTTRYNGIGIGKEVRGTWSDSPSLYVEAVGVMNFDGFDGFCVEPTQGLEPGDVVQYETRNITSLANYDSIARLVTAYLGSSKTHEDAAAIQWAIWEVVSEDSPTLSLLNGRARIEGGASDQEIALLADGYLADLNKYAPAALTYFGGDLYQDIVSWNVIPEPSALGLGLLSGLLLLRRQRH